MVLKTSRGYSRERERAETAWGIAYHGTGWRQGGKSKVGLEAAAELCGRTVLEQEQTG